MVVRMTNGALARFNPAQPGAQGMKVAATGLLVVMAIVFFAARAVRGPLSVARLRQGVRRSGDGRRPRRLVRGHRPVPPPARPADPAHRDHPAQQGPHRRGAGDLPQGEFPDSVGGRAADAQHRRRRRHRPLPADPGRRRHAHPRRRLAPDRRHLRRPRRRAARRDRQGRDLLAAAQDGGVAAARPRARLGDQRGPPRADARGRRSAGWRARSTPTSR